MSELTIHRMAKTANDVDLDDIDPEAAWNDFTVAWRRFRMGGRWSSVHSTFHTFLRTLTPNERRKMWKQKKLVQRARDESSPLWIVVLYDSERDRRRAETPRGKARRARIDKRRANDPTRQAKVREYKARYRAKNKQKQPKLRIVK